MPSRVVASLSYKKEYINHLATQVSFFYSGSSQGRFSYIYSADFNRDGQTNDLIYVPKNASDASEINFVNLTVGGKTYTPADQAALLSQYIDQDPYLRTRRGQYAERNGAKLPWRNQVDFRFAQDIFVTAGKRNTLQFTLDIVNLGNLINRNWGISQIVNNASLLTPVNYTTLVAGGTVKPTFTLATFNNAPVTNTVRNQLTTGTTTGGSTYQMQIGVRYLFN